MLQDAQKAVEYYTKAAHQGYVVAQNKLGEMYAQGRGVERNDAEAMKWLSSS